MNDTDEIWAAGILCTIYFTVEINERETNLFVREYNTTILLDPLVKTKKGSRQTDIKNFFREYLETPKKYFSSNLFPFRAKDESSILSPG